MKILSQRIHPLKGIKMIILISNKYKKKFKCHVCHENFGQYQLEIHFATIHSEILNETEKPDENKVEIL